MQVDHAVDAVVAVLEGDKAADRAEIIAEMEVSGGLDARKDERLEGGHGFLVACGGPFLSMIPNRRSAQQKVAAFSERIMQLRK
jgi:hypothetical protein